MKITTGLVLLHLAESAVCGSVATVAALHDRWGTVWGVLVFWFVLISLGTRITTK